jgi:hypothetical protein
MQNVQLKLESFLMVFKIVCDPKIDYHPWRGIGQLNIEIRNSFFGVRGIRRILQTSSDCKNLSKVTRENRLAVSKGQSCFGRKKIHPGPWW